MRGIRGLHGIHQSLASSDQGDGGRGGRGGRGGGGRNGSGGPGDERGRGRHSHGEGESGEHGQQGEHGEHGGRGFGRHRRTRRGEIRTALLSILVDGPGHGYELIQRIESKTAGGWKPSPGSVYPTLQLLQDEGLVSVDERDGKRVFALTESGNVEATLRSDAAGEDQWARGQSGKPQTMQLFEAMKHAGLAARQVGSAGSPAQIDAAIEIVTEARKKLYQLLAD